MSRFLCVLLLIAFCLGQLGFSEETSSQWPKDFSRPQEPKRPYPYYEEEVSFANTAAGITLAGTLTMPHSQGPCPAVILLHGTAPHDRDCSSDGHKFFLVWADHLTKQGIAVLRFDKRSAGKSTGDYSISTIQDFANDAIAAVEYLKTRQEINTKQIGLIGFSEGGMTAPIAASKCNDVAFIVLMAAPAVNGEEFVLLQETLLQRADGVEETMIVQSRELREQVVAILKEEKSSEIAEMRLQDILEAHLSQLTPSQRKMAEAYYGSKEQQVRLFTSAWFRYWLTYDPISTLKQIHIPVLALNGELDFVVSTEQNLQRIASAFEEIHYKDYTVMQLPKLNHAFQTCETGSVSEYANIEETASPLALNTISAWILERTTEKQL